MPTFTLKAFDAELAKARAAGIHEAARLMATLSDVSPAIAAGALEGLAKDATREHLTAQAAADAELAARPPRATPTGTEQPELGQ
jgi:hypothetical protein